MYIHQNTNDNLNSLLKELGEFIEYLNRTNAFSLLFGFLMIHKRLINVLEERNQQKDSNIIENSEFIFDDIESDYDENKKKAKNTNVTSQMLKSNGRIIQKGDFKKKQTEIDSKEEIKNYFFTEAVNLKFSLSYNNPNRHILISDIYEEAMEKKIGVEDFRKFIEHKLNF